MNGNADNAFDKAEKLFVMNALYDAWERPTVPGSPGKCPNGVDVIDLIRKLQVFGEGAIEALRLCEAQALLAAIAAAANRGHGAGTAASIAFKIGLAVGKDGP